jgi:hypothetical protein
VRREPGAHPVNQDEADRPQRGRRVPALVALAVAAAVIAALAYLHARGINW